MSSNNIFKTINKFERKVGSSTMFKDRSSPFSRPFAKPKKKQLLQKNDLYDITQAKNPFKNDHMTIFEKVILFILAILGKQNEWIEARNKVKALNTRINSFEKIINESNGRNHLATKLKDYKV